MDFIITERFAEITGCKTGIPVITAGGDQQCGAIGQGVVKKGTLEFMQSVSSAWTDRLLRTEKQ